MQRRSTWSEPRLVAAVDLADPSSDLERREELELAIRVLLEKLPPAERAAYLLREGLDYRYRELGAVLGVTEANARQIVTGVRRRLAAGDRAAA